VGQSKELSGSFFFIRALIPEMSVYTHGFAIFERHCLPVSSPWDDEFGRDKNIPSVATPYPPIGRRYNNPRVQRSEYQTSSWDPQEGFPRGK
jgi:hypothetical protein